MAGKALLLGMENGLAAHFAPLLGKLGLRAESASWAGFSPRAWRGRRQPTLLLADAEGTGAPPPGEFCAAIRHWWGGACRLLLLTSDQRFASISAALDAGADDCLPKAGPPELWKRKIARRLADGPAPDASDLTEELPGDLLGLFYRGGALVPLGELADVYPGAVPRLPRYRRLAPPDANWRGVLTADSLDRFLAGRPAAFLSWNRLHLFRTPSPGEYDVPEKVLLRRAGPPLAAAIDKSRLPAGADLYSLIPREGVSAGYVACLLNSRLLDFYFNRLARRGSDGRLRPDDLREAPVPRPTPAGQEELARAAALLTHFGPQPRLWIDQRSKDEVWKRMEDTVFGLYGAGEAVRGDLAALHF